MASLESEVSLPTLEKLNARLPDNVNPHEVAAAWMHAFSAAIHSGNVEAVVALFLEDGLWRDMLALTWDFRTIHGASRIHHLLASRLEQTKPENIRLATEKEREPTLFAMPGLAWVQAFFDFETAVGICSGIFRVVPTPNGQWKTHLVYTNLESLRGFPPKIGHLRNQEPNHGQWLDQRAKEAAFEDADPKVLIIGAGQSGLDVAARLKSLDVSTLVVEKHARVGDSWRSRYQALCLHDPVWYDHMPYLKFPDTWPVFSPAHKLADWLESYAQSMELNIWTSTVIRSVERDDAANDWIVNIVKSDGSKRTLRPKHVVMAIGPQGNHPNMPNIPGMDKFQGKIVHSTSHKTAQDHVGKKVVVVGACTSAHDIAQDLQRHGIDTTMVQRSSTCVVSVKNGLLVFLNGLYSEGGPPLEVADRISASFPFHLLQIMHQMQVRQVMELDKDMLDGLQRVGFKTNFGDDGSGPFMMGVKRGGGYYLDVGASQLIIDGKIKLKNGSVKSFTEDSIVFEDGSALKADVAVFATGYGDLRVPAREVLGDKLASRLGPMTGLNKEGEFNSLYRDSGLPNLYFMTGNLALCRFHSTHLALHIKAKEEGLYSAPYEGWKELHPEYSKPNSRMAVIDGAEVMAPGYVRSLPTRECPA